MHHCNAGSDLTELEQALLDRAKIEQYVPIDGMDIEDAGKVDVALWRRRQDAHIAQLRKNAPDITLSPKD